LSRNRKSQRAFRARQKQRVECLEEQLKTAVSKYEHLQQKYSSLIASYESLSKEQGRNKHIEKDEDYHVTKVFLSQHALGGGDFSPESS
jgi:cell shape-determining protein MreC